MEKSTKNILIAIGTITGIILITKAVLKSMSEARAREIQMQLQRDEQSKPVEQQSSAKNYNPATDAKFIKECLHGANLLMYPEVTELIMTLSDEKTKKLYDYYNKYFRESGRSLTKQMESEWNHNYPFPIVYDAAIKKLKALGLR